MSEDKKRKRKKKRIKKMLKIDIPSGNEDEEEFKGKEWLEKTEHKIQYQDLVVPKSSKLGSGSSGMVLKVWHQKKPYALKIIKSAKMNESMMKEIKSLKVQGQNPNVIRMYEAFLIQGSVRILLEYMDCGSLRDVVNTVENKRIDENILSLITYQILNGLKYLEEVKIIHRDIKPSNILINHRGKAVVADFGLSKILSKSQIASFSFVGTYVYMSPNRLLGKRISYNSDIWSLGLTLLELAIGNFPFDLKAVDHFGYLHLIKDLENKDFSKYGLSEEFLDFFKLCVTYDDKKRPNASTLLKHKFITKHYSDDHKKRISKYLKKNYIDVKRKRKKERMKNKQKKNS